MPADWVEGTKVEFEKSSLQEQRISADEWKAAAAALELDTEDAAILDEAIAEIRAQAKELARRGRR